MTLSLLEDYYHWLICGQAIAETVKQVWAILIMRPNEKAISGKAHTIWMHRMD